MDIDDLTASLKDVLDNEVDAADVQIFSARGNFVGAEGKELFTTLSTMSKVEVIDIKNSSIESMPNVEWLPKSCAVLDVAGNDLEEVVLTGSADMADINFLSVLNMSKNKLLNKITVTNMFALSVVDLSENHFEKFDDVDLGFMYEAGQLSVDLSEQQDGKFDVCSMYAVDGTASAAAAWVAPSNNLNICDNNEPANLNVCDTSNDAKTPAELVFDLGMLCYEAKDDCCEAFAGPPIGVEYDSIYCGGDALVEGAGRPHCASITTLDVIASLPGAQARATGDGLTIKMFDVKADLSVNSNFMIGAFFMDPEAADFWSDLTNIDMQECSLVALPEEAWIPVSVTELELDENKLKKVTFISQGGEDKLKKLKLPNNGLEEIEIQGFGELKELNVSQNALASFDVLAMWAPMPANNLESVDLSNQVTFDVCSIGNPRAAFVPNLDNINICGPTTDGALFECDTETSGTPEELVGAVLSDPLCA
jgi:Leucine-rich repeat (LRR) protein